MLYKASFFFLLVLFLSFTQAQAGRLFPPQNLNETGASCPQNQVLKWTGEGIICGDPTPGVNLPTCPVGQVISGVTGGVPTCITPQFTITVPSCPEGQTLNGIVNNVPTCVAIPSLANFNISCESGKILTGIKDGAPICNSQPLPSHTCIVKNPSYSCPDNTVATDSPHHHSVWFKAITGVSGNSSMSGLCNLTTGDCNSGTGTVTTSDTNTVTLCCTTY